MDNDNESGMDLEEYWNYLHNFNKQFKEIFGVDINESTHKTESSTNEATEHKAE